VVLESSTVLFFWWSIVVTPRVPQLYPQWKLLDAAFFPHIPPLCPGTTS
jgi:hypothetical protein